MLTTTSDFVYGKEIRDTLGLVQGSVVQINALRSIGKSIGSIGAGSTTDSSSSNQKALAGKNQESNNFIDKVTVFSKKAVDSVMESDFVESIKNIGEGENKNYTKLLSDGRKIALDRMIEESRKLGADAIISINFSTTNVMSGYAVEILAFGTAVKLG